MRIPIYQIDAFAERLFTGNPAAVCPLQHWLEAGLMQQIAAENNLAETAFTVKNANRYEIRWFTPETEVDLCGHATLAAAHVLLHHYEKDAEKIVFHSHRSGPLTVDRQNGGLLVLDFPSDPPSEVANRTDLIEALGKAPVSTLKGKTDYLLLYPSQKDIEALQPNFFLLDRIDARGVIVSAPGADVDFVSRFFAPGCGIPEDPVTGSAHTTLVPYWSGVLKKTTLAARQLSARGGSLHCEYLGERVKIAGKAVSFLTGEIQIPSTR